MDLSNQLKDLISTHVFLTYTMESLSDSSFRLKTVALTFASLDLRRNALMADTVNSFVLSFHVLSFTHILTFLQLKANSILPRSADFSYVPPQRKKQTISEVTVSLAGYLSSSSNSAPGPLNILFPRVFPFTWGSLRDCKVNWCWKFSHPHY